MFYWEYGQQVAVRQKNWKAIQPKRDSDWELYDLEKDPSEGRDMAKYQPAILARLTEFAENRDLIFTAILSERTLYGDLATRGLTLFDLNTKAAAALIEEWMPLLTALED